ncbi:hypothetical protein [Paenibacillus phytorum]|uniref:hypothetical protein n=1 Tax=Paenibacillus phytorum TaxID=2654977 RepID=UPI001FEA9171|nr:hypothetical protein [Paenibacillus phytorum]
MNRQALCLNDVFLGKLAYHATDRFAVSTEHIGNLLMGKRQVDQGISVLNDAEFVAQCGKEMENAFSKTIPTDDQKTLQLYMEQ